MIKVNELTGYEGVSDSYFVNESGQIFNSTRNKVIPARKPSVNSRPKVHLHLKGTANNKVLASVDEIVALAYLPKKPKESYLVNVSTDDLDTNPKNLKWLKIADFCKGKRVIKIKSIEGFEDVLDIYFVTELGEVISTRYGILRDIKVKMSKRNGYVTAGLALENGKTKHARVHIIVAKAFIDNPLNKPYVNHINEKRHDNRLANLEWVTPKENNLHSLAKEVYVYDSNGVLFKVYKYTKECVEDGFNQGHVCACARGEVKHHKKFVFSYFPMTKEEVVQRLSKPFYLTNR